MKAQFSYATPLMAALLWVAALLVEPGPFVAGSILMIGVGLLATSSVAVVGMVLTGGRWARRAALTVVGLTGGVAVARPLDPVWVVATGGTAVAAASMFSGAVTRGIRQLPAAAGPPERAVLVPMALLVVPFLLGLASWDVASAPTLIVALTAPFAALWYTRVLPGGLLAVRALWPLLAIGLAVTQTAVPGAVSLLSGVTVALMSWHPSVKVAFHPPRERGTAYAIPPELAPREILDAANLDERGRPRA